MARFSEVPYFILEEYFNSIVPSNYIEPSSDSARLISANHMHVAKDLLTFEFYKKNEYSDYEKIKASIRSDWDSEYNKIILHKLLSPKVVPTDEVKRTVEEPNTYNITASAGEGGSIEPSGEVTVESDTS